MSGVSAGLNPPIAEAARTAKQASIAGKLQEIDICLTRIENYRAAFNKAFNAAWGRIQRFHGGC